MFLMTTARRLVVFDLDGTLVDSLADIGACMNELLEELGLPARAPAQYRRIVGDGARIAVMRATGGAFDDDPARVDELTARYLDIYRARGNRFAAPYAGIPEMLESLGRAGHTLAVLTNKPHDIGVRLVAEMFPSVRFGAVEGQREGVRRKPDPGLLLEIIERLGFERGSTVYVGDTDTDMRTGQAAGVWTVGCLWGFRDAAELRGAGADVVVDGVGEVEGVVARSVEG